MKKRSVRKNTKRKAGRPPAIIDWVKVDYYLKCQCRATGIAALLGITVDTLYNRCKIDNKLDFSAYSQEKKEHGKELLRSKQYQLAIEGNVPMNIWLGKQYLDQKDKTDITSANEKISNIETLSTEELIKRAEASRMIEKSK